MDVETILKWAVIGGVAAFGMYMIYQYAQSQGWLRYRPRLTRMRRAALLPPRGTGLVTGRAGERRLGKPRTEEERLARHFG